MLDFEIEELNQTTDWRDVLTAYLSAHETAKSTQEEFDGWLSRIMSVQGIEVDDLPRIHGKLIALGLLKFQLASRGTGVVYQISSGGRQALANQALAETAGTSEDSEDENPSTEEVESEQAA